MPSLHTLTLSTVVLLAACQEGTAPVAASSEGLERAVLTGSVVQTDPWVDGFFARPAVVVDLDGDGWLDLVSGQDGALINPLTGAHQHAVFGVWPGGPAGFPANPTTEVWSNQAFESVLPVEPVGDTDGDGVVEVAFAAPRASAPAPEEGKVWVAPGVSGAPGTLAPPVWSVEGVQGGTELGVTVRALGDVNGDGYDDLMMGFRRDPYVSFNYSRAVAWYGGPTGFRQIPNWFSPELGLNAVFQEGQLAAGDLDADGYADAFIGDPRTGQGVVWGFRGGPAGLEPTPSWSLVHPASPGNSYFGSTVHVLPDLDGDGYPELAVGAYGFDGLRGKVEVFRGGPAGPEVTPTWSWLGTDPGQGFGDDGLAHGDLDGDGNVDLLVSIYTQWHTPSGQSDGYGGALVIPGVPGGLAAAADRTIRCGHGMDCTRLADGLQVADLDHNGYDDVVLSGRVNSDTGPVPFYTCPGYCAPQDPLQGLTWIAWGGVDTDGDGAPDAIDCAPNDPTIYPGADDPGYDGIDQDCEGDDFDLDADGVQADPWGTDGDDIRTWISTLLTVGGSCTTSVTVSADGLTPGATAELWAGTRYRPGTMYDIPPPHPCQDINVEAPIRVGAAVVDGTGHVDFPALAGSPDVCSAYLQAVDRSTCALSQGEPSPP